MTLQKYSKKLIALFYFLPRYFHVLPQTLGKTIKSWYLCAMKQVKLIYSEDFGSINTAELSDCCVHMICLGGEGSFVFNDKCFHFCKGDILILTLPHKLRNLAAGKDMKIEYFAAQHKFLNNQLPSNNFGIGGGISLYSDPVIHVTKEESEQFLFDIHTVRDRMKEEETHPFFLEMMASLCRTMMYDLFAFHARRDKTRHSSDRRSYMVKELINLLSAGRSRTERSVEYYAGQLNVTPKYLSKTVKRTTGNSVTSFIDRYTLPIIKEYLDNENLSLTQIAQLMNFASLSYFSRYCSKHMGMTPSEYRMSLQPGK